jgi:hypothetical protein
VLVLTDPASWPFSTPQSTVSVVPVLLTGVNVSPIPGSTSQNVNLTYVNQTDGSVFTVQATAIVTGTPPPGGSGSTTGSSNSGPPATQ